MNTFEKFLKFLDARMETPVPYGWFHIMWIAIVILASVAIVVWGKKLSDKKFRIISGIIAGVMILLEIYKQLNFSYNASTDTWDYQWYAFPFQFCSTPMYVLLLVSLLKECKFRDYLCCFLATFGLFAGIAVMALPVTVYIDTIGINIQTMVHHGGMVVIGVLMLVSGRAKIEHKTILKGAIVFAVLTVVALLMNITFHNLGDGSTFNMFYIGPYGDCEIPILSLIYLNAPYIVFLLSYLIGFTICGYIMLLIAMLIKFINKKVQSKKHQ